MKSKGNFFFHLSALAVIAIWGSTFVSTKKLLGFGMVPAEIFVVRFILAYVGLWMITLVKNRGAVKLFPGSWKDELLFVLAGITGGSLYFLTENTALELEMACNVSFIVCTAPLLTCLLALALGRGGRITKPLVAGTLLALVGMALMFYQGRSSVSFSLKGDLLALAAAMCWAVYTNLISPLMPRFGTVVLTRKVFFYGLLTILPVFCFQPWTFPVAQLFSWPVLQQLLFLGVLASLVCFVVWNPVIGRLGVVASSNYIYLNPVFTLISAMIFLGERLTPVAAAGAAVILLGVWLAGRQNGNN